MNNICFNIKKKICFAFIKKRISLFKKAMRAILSNCSLKKKQERITLVTLYKRAKRAIRSYKRNERAIRSFLSKKGVSREKPSKFPTLLKLKGQCQEIFSGVFLRFLPIWAPYSSAKKFFGICFRFRGDNRMECAKNSVVLL